MAGTPAWAQRHDLPSADDLAYVRTLASVGVMCAVAVYLFALALEDPGKLARAVRKRVIG